MFHKLLKNKKFILATILIAGLFLIFSTKSANACNLITNTTACIEELVTYLVQSITYVIFFVLGKAINLISQFLFPVVYLGNQAIGSPLVRTGFKICLQIANLGFVVSIIYVAFATITKFNDYKIKDFLIKLITAAVLINFSFAMAGTVMDISNVVGNYFLSKSIPGDGNLEGFSTQMANAFNLGKLNAVKEGPNEGFTDNLSSLGRSFLNLIFSMGLSIFISIIVLLTFIGIVGMMLARYVWMVILITCMPIIWLCYMSPFPEIKGYFNKWWKMFLKWIYFYPVTAFFLYLALLTATSVTNGASSAVYSQGSAQELNKTILNESGLTGLIDAILKAAMFMAALYLGSQAGGGFMKTTMSWANGAKNKVIGTYRGGFRYVGQGTRRIATSPLRLQSVKKGVESMQSVGGNIKGWKGVVARGILNATGIRPAARLAGGALDAVSNSKDIAKEAEERLKNRSIDDLARNFQALTAIEKTVALKRGLKEDKLDKFEVVDYLANVNRDTWKKFASEKDLEAIEKKTGVNGAMAKSLDEGKKSGDYSAFETEAKKFYSGFSKDEFGKIMSSAMKDFKADNAAYGSLGDKAFEKFQKTLISFRLDNQPGSFGKIVSGMATKDFKSLMSKIFQASLKPVIEELEIVEDDSSKIADTMSRFATMLKSKKLMSEDEIKSNIVLTPKGFIIKNLKSNELIAKHKEEENANDRGMMGKILMTALNKANPETHNAFKNILGRRLTDDAPKEEKEEEKKS